MRQLRPHAFERLRAALESSPQAPFAYGRALSAHRDGSGWHPDGLMGAEPQDLHQPLRSIFGRNPVHASGALVRTAGVRAAGGFDPEVRFAAVESVGPKVLGELVKTAFYAVGAACLGIMAYIWLRFEWQFAVGCVVSLIHDVLLTIGLFSLFQLRFDLTTIAALLTTLGFSCNDTVVVFDRLRENLIKYKTRPLIDLMNLTCNETLSRTIMTAVTTGIALTAMLIFGGDVIREFVVAMLFGVFVGCYSTIYVAKNIVLWLGVKRDWAKPGEKKDKPATEEIPAAFRDAP